MFEAQFKGHKTLTFDRRKFLGMAAGLVAAGVLPERVLALAAPYSFKQGAYDVTVVSDGTLTLQVAMIYPEAPPEDVAKLMGAALQDGKIAAEASPVLLKAGSEVILFDTGSGQGFQPTAGKIAESLKAAGTDPSAITKVIFTHAHPDHCWGTLGDDGKSLFPNASLHMAETEWNFWAAPDLASKMPEQMQAMVKTTQAELSGMKGKISFFKPGDEVVPGVNVLDTAGHTPGHVSFEMGGGDGLIITGDAITNPLVFFPHPDWKFAFDANHESAVAKRKELLDMSAAGKKKLLGFHWPYPGIATAGKKDGAYVYVPVS